MPAAARVSIEEYLSTDYKPACELIRGELVQKPMGTLEHMRLERRLARALEKFEAIGLGEVVWELSIRRGDEVRIPDVVVVPPGARVDRGVLMDPPLLCVEILSPSDRQSEQFSKCESYHAWGVPYCWILDPIRRLAWEYHDGSAVRLLPDGSTLAAGAISVDLSEVFA